MQIDVSILIPVRNEEKNLAILSEELQKSLGPLDHTYEVLFLDDGSTDQSVQTLNHLKNSWNYPRSHFHYVSFPKHHGKSHLLSYGFKESKGHLIITMDGDLQDNPHEIPHFIRKINEGYDMVSGWKLNRKDSQQKKIISWIFNKTTSVCTGINLHDFGSGFKAYRKSAVTDVFLSKGMHRFLPVLIAAKNLRIAEIQYPHRPRRFGKSKYGFLRIIEGFQCFLCILWIVHINRSLLKQ